MIHWAGFLGNLLDFILFRLERMQLDMPPDQRSTAAKDLVNLRTAVVLLETATSDFLYQISTVKSREKPRLFLAAVDSVASLSDSASVQFSRSLQRLSSIFVIEDNKLARLICGPYTDRSFSFMAKGIPSQFAKLMIFRTRGNQNSVFFLDFSLPAEENIEGKLQRAYESAREVEGGVGYSHRDYTDLLESLTSELRVFNSIADNDIKKILALDPVLSAHLKTLSAARSRLDEFIREKFSLEDFLYVPG